jgi:ribokinase
MKNKEEIWSKTPIYEQVVGIGGIGYGVFFSLDGNHDLGREESRAARLEEYKDFCKLHNVLHYLGVFLGEKMPIYAIGAVGNDAQAQILVQMIKDVNIDTSGILYSKERPTLFSVCYQFPDFSGGNISSSNNASLDLTNDKVENLFHKIVNKSKKGIALSLPEVPFESRLALLKCSRKDGFLNLCSILNNEVKDFCDSEAVEMTDILVLNQSEANAFLSHLKLLDLNDLYMYLRNRNAAMKLLITQGNEGSLVFDNQNIYKQAAFKNEVKSTAGAGDAYLSGLVFGLILGYPLCSTSGNVSAMFIASILASMKVGSSDTIHLGINKKTFKDFMNNNLSKIEY